MPRISFQKSLDNSVLFTLRNSFIYEILNEVLKKTFPSGIPVVDNSPKVLTLHDLGFGFALWLGACGISIVGFIFEICRFSVADYIKSYFGLLVLLDGLKQKILL